MKSKEPKLINFDTVMQQAVRFLGVKQLTAYELKGKLYKKNLPYKLILEVVSECERLGYINDEDSVVSRLEGLQAKGLGDTRIGFELSRAGFKGDLIEQSLLEHDRDIQPVIIQMLARKWKLFFKEGDLQKANSRAYRFFVGRGFSFDDIKQALETYLKEKQMPTSFDEM